VTGRYPGPKKKLFAWLQSAIMTSACYLPSLILCLHWMSFTLTHV